MVNRIVLLSRLINVATLIAVVSSLDTSESRAAATIKNLAMPPYNRSAEEFETWNELDSFGRGLFNHGINVIEYRFHNGESGPSPMAFRIEGSVVSGSTGDFDGDGVLTAADIDRLSAAVLDGDSNSDFDLNNDHAVNAIDRSIWIEELRRTWRGDADMDGEFNSGDLVEVFRAGKYETSQPATWVQGDWDGNRLFDSGDLIAGFQDRGFELGPKPAVAVPEPTSALVLIGALGGAIVYLRPWQRRLIGQRHFGIEY